MPFYVRITARMSTTEFETHESLPELTFNQRLKMYTDLVSIENIDMGTVRRAFDDLPVTNGDQLRKAINAASVPQPIFSRSLVSEYGLDWRAAANCRGRATEIFFPDQGGSHSQALEICRGCVVREDCLEFAIENPQMGIWGGLSERGRRRLIGEKAEQNR
jgi:WhiB family redox-sensing transcriptional regulator